MICTMVGRACLLGRGGLAWWSGGGEGEAREEGRGVGRDLGGWIGSQWQC